MICYMETQKGMRQYAFMIQSLLANFLRLEWEAIQDTHTGQLQMFQNMGGTYVAGMNARIAGCYDINNMVINDAVGVRDNGYTGGWIAGEGHA